MDTALWKAVPTEEDVTEGPVEETSTKANATLSAEPQEQAQSQPDSSTSEKNDSANSDNQVLIDLQPLQPVVFIGESNQQPATSSSVEQSLIWNNNPSGESNGNVETYYVMFLNKSVKQHQKAHKHS